MQHNELFHILPFLHFENEMLLTGIENVMKDVGN
jgi:hypothetical protein